MEVSRSSFLLLYFFIRQLGTHYPDHAIALISAAGWIKKENYGDSNLFFRHDIGTSHTSPEVKVILEACIAENDADKHVSNLHVSTKDLHYLAFATGIVAIQWTPCS